MTRQGNEKDFLAQVIKLSRSLGWRHYHQHYSLGADRGFPDLVLVNSIRKRVVYAELKTGRYQLSPEQMEWRDCLLAAGQEWYEWRPEQVDEIARILSAGSLKE